MTGLKSSFEQKVRMVRRGFAQEGVRFAPAAAADTLLVSEPVRVGKRRVIYRAIVDPAPGRTLVFLEGFYVKPSDSTAVRVLYAEIGDEGRAWRKVEHVAGWLDLQRRRGH